VQLREYFARVKMFSDLIFSKEPHFLGEEIEII
jgi:vancomycin permeability regulator SanA